jgi:predicted dehydrogenase
LLHHPPNITRVETASGNACDDVKTFVDLGDRRGQMNRIRLALLGCGLWGRLILRDSLSLGASVWVVDPTAGARTAAREMGADGVRESLDGIPEVDGIIVASPASTHYRVISDALDRGVPIYCEKPFTLDLDEAHDLMDRAGDRIFVMHVWRYHPAIQRMRDLAADGALGEVRWLRTVRTNWTSPRTDCDPVWTLLPHDLSIILEITGEIPRVASAVGEFRSGCPVGMLAQFAGRYPIVAEVSTSYEQKRRDVRVHGDQAIASFRGDGGGLWLLRPGAKGGLRQECVPVDNEPALLREIRAFIDYLRGGPAPRSGRNDALLISEAMHRIRVMAGIDSPKR